MTSSGESQPVRPPAGAWQARRPTGRSRDRSRAAVPGGAVRPVGANGRAFGYSVSRPTCTTPSRMCERLRPDVVMVDALLDPRCHLAQLLTSSDDSCSILSVVREPLRSPRYVATAHRDPGCTGWCCGPRSRRRCWTRSGGRTWSGVTSIPELAALATGLGVRHTVTARQPLSRREYQVLQLISDGLENQAIAKSLFVSVETIRTHVKSILRKLHARDRAHAVAVAFRLGVLVAHRETPADRRAGGPDRRRRAGPGERAGAAPADGVRAAAGARRRWPHARVLDGDVLGLRRSPCSGYRAVIYSSYRRVARSWEQPDGPLQEQRPRPGVQPLRGLLVQDRLGKGPFEQADEDTARGVLAELHNLATGPLGASFAEGDRDRHHVRPRRPTP